MLSNLLFRIRQYLKDNERKIIKWALVVFGLLLLIFVICLAFGKLQAARYDARIKEYDAQYQQKDAQAKALKAEADGLKHQVEAKQAESRFWEQRALVAEQKMTQTRTIYVETKKQYEEIRNAPDIPADISNCDACQELAAAGHPCR